MKKFYGWIPTITGRLSFSTIGTGKNPEKEFKYINAFANQWIIAVAQKRRTTDAAFGRVGDFLNKCRKREGHSVFVFFGQTNLASDFDILSGPCVELSETSFRILFRELVQLRSQEDPAAAHRAFPDIAGKFLTEAAARPGAYCSVEIRRDGRTTIGFVEDDRLTPEVHKRNASQFFFFLRDVTHRHQHHAESSDTILDVTEAERGERAWKRETLYSLYRWVIHRKRDRSLEELLNCIGILAYAKSFELTHYATHSFEASSEPKPTIALPNYNHDTTLSSVQSSIEILKAERQRPGIIEVFFTRVLPVFTGFLAILIPLYSLSPSKSPNGQQELVSTIIEFLNRNVLTVILSLLAVSVLYGLSGAVRSSFRLSAFMHDCLRLALSLSNKKARVVWALVLLALALLGIAVSGFYFSTASQGSAWIGPSSV